MRKRAVRTLAVLRGPFPQPADRPEGDAPAGRLDRQHRGAALRRRDVLDGFGASVTAAGLLMPPMLAAMFFSGVLSGRLEPVVGAKALLTTGAALGAVACGFLAIRHDEQWQIGVVAGLFGLGIGLAFASMANLIGGSVPADQTGAATGMNADIRTIGGSIGAAVTSVLVTGHLQPSGLPSSPATPMASP